MFGDRGRRECFEDDSESYRKWGREEHATPTTTTTLSLSSNADARRSLAPSRSTKVLTLLRGTRNLFTLPARYGSASCRVLESVSRESRSLNLVVRTKFPIRDKGSYNCTNAFQKGLSYSG